MRAYIILTFLLFFITPTFAIKIDLESKNWNSIYYSNITPNVVVSTDKGLEISVDNSSSALVLAFDIPIIVKKIRIAASIKGNINYKNLSPGAEGADDFPLRLGLILKGEKKLNFIQKTFAPSWLIELDKMSSKKGGFDKVYTLIYHTSIPSFKLREHPSSEFFIEKVEGKFINSTLSSSSKLSLNKEVIGIWLSADGDDTKSSFKILIEDIEVN